MNSFCPELVGSMSQGAAGNPTVAMVEAAFKHHSLNWRYVNMEVSPEHLGTAVQGARAMGFRGFNLSMPHKVSVIEHLDGLGESAAVIGAVNCVVRRDERWIGENTDGKGFLRSLQVVADPKDQTIVLFGAGGAARAIAVELALAGAAKLYIVNRDAARGQDLANLIGEKTAAKASWVPWQEMNTLPEEARIVINGTSIGLYDTDAALDFDLESLRPGTVVADVVFNPVETRLLREAAARQCVVVDGLGMLVDQGVIGVQYWTGIDPDPRVMRHALRHAMGV
ncbi:MAG: shikimate dehydrogenase [Verrucomicrobiales bacterium]|nr:shikimate dehydrogenase [Verrucomicrobiales bacterium]